MRLNAGTGIAQCLADGIKVELSKHCEEQMMVRDITIEQVETVMNNPNDSYYDNQRQNYKTYGKVNNPVREDMPYLVLIHNKINTSVRIITAMWADEGGLRAHGFNTIR